MVDTATTAVQAAQVAGSMAAHDMSMLGLFLQADFVVKGVMISLLLASVWCWAIIIEKLLVLKSQYINANKFQEKFWSSNDLDQFFDQVHRKRPHPLHRVWIAGIEEWNLSKKSPPRDADEKRSLLDRVGKAMMVARNRELDGLERGLGFLATSGAIAPFIGLFGTVWGIMNSFKSIAAEKSTNLAVVAPGIAEALFATAVGLFVAIPAVIAYNRISADINRFSGMMEDFSTEFSTLLSRQLDKIKS